MDQKPPLTGAAYERAKQLYTNYYGSSFSMGREDEYEEYAQYHVPPALERQWRAERIAYLTSKLSPDDRVTVIALSIWGAKEALPQLIQMADGVDDHTRLSAPIRCGNWPPVLSRYMRRTSSRQLSRRLWLWRWKRGPR